MTQEFQACPNCGNESLAIRTDLCRDKRAFVCCPECGGHTPQDVWNRVPKRPELEPKGPVLKCGANHLDLEQQILRCWNITDDIETLYKGVGDIGMTEDQIMNALLGMQELYTLKFNELFSTFEQLVKQKAL